MSTYSSSEDPSGVRHAERARIPVDGHQGVEALCGRTYRPIESSYDPVCVEPIECGGCLEQMD